MQTPGKGASHRGSDKVRGIEGMEVTLLTCTLEDTHAPHTHSKHTYWGRDT
jgi:hypothetical protein